MSDEVKDNTFTEQESLDKSENRTEATIETEPTEPTSLAENADVEAQTKSQQNEDLLTILKENQSLLQEIKHTIQNRLEYDAVKEKAFDKLYEEMRRQKEASDLLDRAVKPVLSDLLLLYDSMKKFEASLINQPINDGELFQDFRYILEELLEILYRQEVLPIEENTSEPFNSKIHKATKTENAESKDDDFKIISIVRNGFTWRDKVLRPQEVVIKRFLNKV